MPIIKKDKRLNIIRVPLNKPQLDIPCNFRPCDQLYLGYLENKLKVKPELRNVDYVPKMHNTVLRQVNETEASSIKFEEEEEKIWDLTEKREKRNKQYEEFYEEMNKKDKDDRDEEKRRSERERDDDERRETDREQSERRRSHRSRRSGRRDRDDRRSRRRDREERSRSRDNESEKRDTRTELDKILDGSINEKKNDERTEIKSELIREPKKRNDENEIKSNNVLPSITDIEKGEVKNVNIGGSDIRDIGHITFNEEKENNDRREMIFRFKILRDGYPNGDIPTFSEYTDSKTLKQIYDDTVRRIRFNDTLHNYRDYLRYGFMATEWILGGWFGFEMTGFTMEQMVNMNKYDKLLVELGEKNYSDGPSNFPVELRLLGIVLFNAVVFLVGKKITRTMGININPTQNNSQPIQKPKMKGPNVQEFTEKKKQ